MNVECVSASPEKGNGGAEDRRTCSLVLKYRRPSCFPPSAASHQLRYLEHLPRVLSASSHGPGHRPRKQGTRELRAAGDHRRPHRPQGNADSYASDGRADDSLAEGQGGDSDGSGRRTRETVV